MIIKISAYETEFDAERDQPTLEETFYHETLDNLTEGFVMFLEDVGIATSEGESDE